MYEQVHQRPKGPAKIAGGMTALLVTVGVGYALSTGLAMDIVRMVETETELAIITPPKPPEVLPLPEEPPPEEPVVEVPEPVLVPLPEYIPPVVEAVIVAPPAPVEPVVAAPAPTPVSVTPDTRPKLQASNKPPYPPASVRAQEEGQTGIEVCVSAQGRVTQASVVSPSGHPRLDDAALKWVRGSRFTPAKVGGAPQQMCGHEVVYQWDLEDA